MNRFFGILTTDAQKLRVVTETYATDSYQNLLFSILRFHTHFTHLLLGPPATAAASWTEAKAKTLKGRDEAPGQDDRSPQVSSEDAVRCRSWPQGITVITHAFKRERFTRLHAPALRWPTTSLPLLPSFSFPSPVDSSPGRHVSEVRPDTGRFNFVGIDPPEHVTPQTRLREGEERDGWGLWSRDLYGVRTELAGKRRKRGWGECAPRALVEEVGGGKQGEHGRAREIPGIRALLEWTGGPDGMQIYPGPLPWELQ
ncbi:MAG: hypothetical protein M1827_004231 [Pycnora praestabilis]|nr:MAG: hypothetical protein M1827_004231 [Pycnora praestabilis]